MSERVGKLVLELGPMKSGKSTQLAIIYERLVRTNVPILVVRSKQDLRDEGTGSRLIPGGHSDKILSLADVLDTKAEVIIADELHMFPESDVMAVRALLNMGKRVFLAGLDMDYMGLQFEIVRLLFLLGPTEVNLEKAACVVCQDGDATHTQIFHEGIPVIGGLPPVCSELSAELGFDYGPVCRRCHVGPGNPLGKIVSLEELKFARANV